MTTKNPARFKPLAIVCLISVVASLLLGLFGPRLVSPPGDISVPQWLFWTTLGFGAAAVVTVPFAWRWLFLRRRDAA